MFTILPYFQQISLKTTNIIYVRISHIYVHLNKIIDERPCIP